MAGLSENGSTRNEKPIETGPNYGAIIACALAHRERWKELGDTAAVEQEERLIEDIRSRMTGSIGNGEKRG